jgi:hypothetical protein
MRSVFKKIIAASALAATSIAVVQPAQARDNTGVAVAAGIIGLGVGAALVSDHRGYDGGGYYYNDYPQAYNYPSSYGYYAPAYGYSSYGYDYGRGYGYDRGRGWGRDNWRGDRHDRGRRGDRHDRRDGRWDR